MLRKTLKDLINLPKSDKVQTNANSKVNVSLKKFAKHLKDKNILHILLFPKSLPYTKLIKIMHI